MIKRLFLLTGCFFLIYSCPAQFDTSFIKKNIRHCADSLIYAFKTRSWEVFARYSNPSIVGSMGGKKEFSNYIAAIFAQAPDSAWKKYETGKIRQVVKKGGDYQAIIELNSVIEWEGNRITTTSHLIGESWDGGMFWTFFDPQGDAVTAKQINPNLRDELIIPKREEKKEPVNRPKSNH